MVEKAGIAQFLDKLFDGLSKNREESSDLANILPKPESQEIGDGVIVWRWTLCDGNVVIESVLATREPNQSKMEKDEYSIGLKMPDSENGTYALSSEVAKEIGQAILSAHNWKEIWKLHAGDFLLEELSQPAKREPEIFEAEVVKEKEFDV